MKINKSQLKLLHVAKRQAGLSDAEYRDMLAGYGVESGKDLGREQFDQVLNHLAEFGFVHPRTGPKRGASPERVPLLKKIDAQLADLGKERSYADSIAKRMYKVERTVWCTPAQLKNIVAALTYAQQKSHAKARRREEENNK